MTPEDKAAEAEAELDGVVHQWTSFGGGSWWDSHPIAPIRGLTLCGEWTTQPAGAVPEGAHPCLECDRWVTHLRHGPRPPPPRHEARVS